MPSLQSSKEYLSLKYGNNKFLTNQDGNSKTTDIEKPKKDSASISVARKTSYNKDYFEAKAKKTQGIIAAAFEFAGVSYVVPRCISSICIPKLKDIGKNLTDNEFASIKNAFSKLIDETGLSKKGVKSIIANEENKAVLKDIAQKEIDGNILFKYLPKKYKDELKKGFEKEVLKGNNAFFAPFSNTIVMSSKKDFSWACFHEMGHALNANFSKIGKTLQKCRNLYIVVSPIVLFTALYKGKKSDNKKTTGTFDKITTFIKNNAGKIILLSFAPMLIEEGMASFKGGKLAKKMLNPELARQVSKGNKLAYLTYLGMAGALSYGIYMAKKVKNAFVVSKNNNKKLR